MPHSRKNLFKQAQSEAQAARFPEMLAICQQIVESHRDDVNVLLDVGALLLNFGFLAKAHDCYERVRALAPSDLRPQVNLANLARDAGDHGESRHRYETLLARLPDQYQ